MPEFIKILINTFVFRLKSSNSVVICIILITGRCETQNH